MPLKPGSSWSQRRRMPFGDKTDAGAEAGAVVEADLVADFGAERAAALPGHAGGDGAGGDAAGLEDDDAVAAGSARARPAGVVEEHLGDLGGFAGAGGGDEDEGRIIVDSTDNPRNGFARWEGKVARRQIQWAGEDQRSTSSTASTTTEKSSSNPEGMNLEVFK